MNFNHFLFGGLPGQSKQLGGNGFGSYFDTLLNGTDPSNQQYSTQTPQQSQLLQQLMQGLQGGQSNIPGLDYLQSLFSNDEGAFHDYEAPLMRQFNEQVVPGLAERFSGAGMGSRNSSAFNNQLASAGTRLTELLGQQRGQLRQGGLGQINSLFGQTQNPQFENVMMQGQPGLLHYLAQGAGNAAGKFVGGF